jgi:hypothetical protein
VPVTDAVNCREPPVATIALVGDIVTTIGVTRVTVAVFDCVGSAADVAVTNTMDEVGGVAGAV